MNQPQAWRSLESRRKKAEKASLYLKHAAGERSGGWEHLRSLLRWWPLNPAAPIPYDRATAKAILEEPDGQERFKEYMRHVIGNDGEIEPLPAFVLHDCCREAIHALAALVKHEKQQMDVATRAVAAESILAGMMAHRESPEMRPPLEAFTAQRLEALKQRVPNPDAQQIHMAATQAEADYRRRFGTRKGWSFSRIGKR
jgi:hypothetical protein